MTSLETITSSREQVQPALRVVRRILNIPEAYYKNTKARLNNMGIPLRDFHLGLREGVPTTLISSAETARLYAAVGKVPVPDELTELGRFVTENISPALKAPIPVMVRPTDLREDLVARPDASHRGTNGKTTRYLYRTAVSSQLYHDRQEVRELVVEHIGVDDPSILSRPGMWDRHDYRRVRIASVLKASYVDIVDKWLEDADALPEQIMLSGATPEEQDLVTTAEV